MPKLSDSEVITMEVVGTYLSFLQDQEVFDDFRRHYAHFFPLMAKAGADDLVVPSGELVGGQRAAVVSDPRHVAAL